MTKVLGFTDELIAQRRAAEPAFRNFPSLHSSLVSSQKDLLRYKEGSRELADFFERERLQDTYPFVWVRNAVDVRRGEKGAEECTFVQEVMVSYDIKDVPATAPLVFNHGELVSNNPRAQPLMVGKTPRFINGVKDILYTFPVCAVGPSSRLPPQPDEPDDADISAPAP